MADDGPGHGPLHLLTYALQVIRHITPNQMSSGQWIAQFRRLRHILQKINISLKYGMWMH